MLFRSGEGSNTGTDDRDQELEELRSKVAAFEKRDKDRAAAERDRQQRTRRKEREAAEKSGELGKLLEMTRSELAEKDSAIAELTQELGQLRGQAKARTLAQQVVAQAGGGNTEAIAALIPSLGLPLDADVDRTLVSGEIGRAHV